MLLLPLLFLYQNDTRYQLLEAGIQQLISETTRATDFNTHFLQQAPPQLAALSRILSQKLMHPVSAEVSSAFNARIMQFDDGAWRNRRDHFDGTMQAGVFIPPSVTLDDTKKYFYLTVLDVLDLFGAATTSNPVFDNIWVLDHDRGEVIFDRSYPDFVYMMQPGTDYTDTPWIQLVSPQHNPERKARWTPALFDPVSQSWLVSLVYPLDIQGTWRATLGIDMNIDEVLVSLRSSQHKVRGEQNFLLDNADHFILAGPWQAELEKHSEAFALPEQETALTQMLHSDFAEQSTYLGTLQLNGEQYEVISRLIQPMGWRYLRLVPTDQILAPFHKQIKRATLILILFVISMLLIFDWITRKLIVIPLMQLVANVNAMRAGEAITPIQRDDELGQLNRALCEMHEEIEQDTHQLLESEKRYRQVVSSIHETLFQINEDKQWQFLSPAWRSLTGYDLRASLYRPVTEFFHISDRERIQRVMAALFEGHIHNWRGEIRLQHANYQAVWVTISMNKNDDDQQHYVLSGTIENQHYQHIADAMTRLVRELEQKVMTSYCNLESVLEWTTKELLTILDIALVWVKLCRDEQSQILAHSGELSAFLFENNRTWSGLHQADSPVMEAIHQHRVKRVSALDAVSENWKQRLEYEGIQDSLFIPFYLAGGHAQAVIGLHSTEKQTFDDRIEKLMTEFSISLRLICQMIEDQGLMRLHRTAVENVANAIMITDNQGRIEWVNDAFSKQTLYTLPEILGETPRILNSNLPESNTHLEAMWQTIKAGKVWSGEIINRRKDGALMSVYQTVTPLFDDIGSITHYISVSEDVTERNEQIKRIAFMATHDELTQLPNRTLLDDRLQQAIAHAQRQQSLVAVLFVDIDHFKYINDSLGHQVGDELLKTLAHRLTSALRQEDTVARFGGDEFVIILPEVDGVNSIKTITHHLLQEIKKPFHILEHELIITGSIGISLYPDDGHSADELIQNADSAMYQAKEQGRNTSQFFTTEINEKITRRLTLEKALRKAVENQEFILYYQPKVDLSTQSVVGVEALIRWERPQQGLVSPAEFIPLAEETGVILEIGHWVMECACRQMKDWQARFPKLKNISINVSARQFWQDNFLREVTDILERTRVDPHKIEFELTESLVMNDMEQAIAMMQALSKLGITLSIDDFGTGYSSLSYLQHLPVDILKIDRSFVQDLTEKHADSAIICSIMALAKNFNLQVVAEGIEHHFQHQALAQLGCQFGQGYLYSRPVHADEIETLLATQADHA